MKNVLLLRETWLNVSLFALHVLLWTSWTLMIHWVRGDNADYSFNPISVIVLTETAKCLLSGLGVIASHCLTPTSTSASSTSSTSSEKRTLCGALSASFVDIDSNWSVGRFFAVPALVYALYNSFFFLNMTFFDPVAYRVLINIRILWSGLFVQIAFKRHLGVRRWIALGLLALGCAVNQMGADFSFDVNLIAILSVLLQSFMSSLGGVYSEVYLKRDVAVSIHVKNFYLYGFSIAFNLLWVLVYDPALFTSPALFFKGFNWMVGVIIVLGTLSGFSTALFLRYLSVLLKEYAHSGEVLSTALFSYVFFGVDLNWRVIVSIILTSISIAQYNTAPEMNCTENDNERKDINV